MRRRGRRARGRAALFRWSEEIQSCVHTALIGLESAAIGAPLFG
jgi:hypothetical protein